MTSIPAWYPDPEEPKPAPMPLLLIQGFLNTRDLDQPSDLLDDVDSARAWLRSAELLRPGLTLGPADLDRARAVREALRSIVESQADGSRLGPLRQLAATHVARLTIDDHGAVAVENSQQDELADGLFGLLLIVRAAQEDGTFSRLKACGNPDCRWVYYDRSRNRQGHWCEMAVCGNRLKNRTLRERRR